MPKKLKPESQAEQSERFKRDAQSMVDAGELSLTEADARFEEILRRAAPGRSPDQAGTVRQANPPGQASKSRLAGKPRQAS